MKKIIALLICSIVVASMFMVSSAGTSGSWHVYYGSPYYHDTIDYVGLSGASTYTATVTERGGTTLYTTDVTIGGTTNELYGEGSSAKFYNCTYCMTATVSMNYTGGSGFTDGDITY